MVPWILSVLCLFVVQTLLPASIRYLGGLTEIGDRLKVALGPRDQQPPMPPLGGRAERALANLQEAMPVFLALALLQVMHPKQEDMAIQGAQIFFVARLLYVPAYLSGISGVRSLVWMISWVGLGMLIVALR
jgi:uncharacterized MAPEG superfamily protein